MLNTILAVDSLQFFPVYYWAQELLGKSWSADNVLLYALVHAGSPFLVEYTMCAPRMGMLLQVAAAYFCVNIYLEDWVTYWIMLSQCMLPGRCSPWYVVSTWKPRYCSTYCMYYAFEVTDSSVAKHACFVAAFHPAIGFPTDCPLTAACVSPLIILKTHIFLLWYRTAQGWTTRKKQVLAVHSLTFSACYCSNDVAQFTYLPCFNCICSLTSIFAIIRKSTSWGKRWITVHLAPICHHCPRWVKYKSVIHEFYCLTSERFRVDSEYDTVCVG